MAYDLGVLGSASDEDFLFPVFCCGVGANHYKSDTALNGDMSVDRVHFLKLFYFFLTTYLKLRSKPHNFFWEKWWIFQRICNKIFLFCGCMWKYSTKIILLRCKNFTYLERAPITCLGHKIITCPSRCKTLVVIKVLYPLLPCTTGE